VSITKLVIRWLIIVIALVIAVLIVPGIRVEDTNAWIAFGVMAVVLALVNAVIRPILVFLSCGCVALTMGLFLVVINAFTLWLASWITVNWLGLGFYVDSIWAALLGGVIVSLVSWLLGMFVKDD
jgi:putative membrane protein